MKRRRSRHEALAVARMLRSATATAVAFMSAGHFIAEGCLMHRRCASLKKDDCFRNRLFSGWSGWIRTTVDIVNRFTVCPLWPRGNTPRSRIKFLRFGSNGAGGRIRTPDLLITNQLLYRLSYTSMLGLSAVIILPQAFGICKPFLIKISIFFCQGPFGRHILQKRRSQI